MVLETTMAWHKMAPMMQAYTVHHFAKHFNTKDLALVELIMERAMPNIVIGVENKHIVSIRVSEECVQTMKQVTDDVMGARLIKKSKANQ